MEREKVQSMVIADYLSGQGSLRQLELKFGIPFTTIGRWVRDEMKKKKPQKRSEIAFKQAQEVEPGMPADIDSLQAELKLLRLQNKLLNNMIDIAEEQLKVPIRKKPGARQ